MKLPYPHLFSPLTVGRTTYKNRIFQAPATPMMIQQAEPYPTEPYIEYYAEKARGGTANVCVAGHIMNPNGPKIPGFHNIDLRNSGYHRYWAKLTDRVHSYDAKISIEFLAFTYSGIGENGKPFICSINGENDPDGSPRPMLTREAMEAICRDYADCAEAALKVGFDGILIHGGHGLVLHRFMSPLFNHRTDEFGGSFENRCRFPLMVLDAIRERVGNKLVIEYRISGSELADICEYPDAEKQFGPQDVAAFLKLAGDRIDIAHISAGNMSIPHSEAIMHPTIFGKPANNAHLAKEIKKIGVPQPVLTLGAFLEPELMEETLKNGEADLIAMARGTIADPQLPNKAKAGKADEIIPCIKCFNCLDHSRQLLYRCGANPTVGREKVLKEQLPAYVIPKRVAIIGGGVAGMAAAIYAKQFGHTPVIFEKDDHLGGKLVAASTADFKYDLRRFMDYQKHMVEKLGVEVRLNTAATPEMIEKEGFDAVLAAVGSEAFKPPIQGIDSPNVLTAEDAYGKLDTLGRNIIIIGGGEIGCETALALSEQGKAVTIIEMLPELSPETFRLTRDIMLWRISKEVSFFTKASVKEISEHSVRFTDECGEDRLLSCDHVILSTGMRPRSGQAEAFRDCAPYFRAIGDCTVAKNVRICTQTAYDAVFNLS